MAVSALASSFGVEIAMHVHPEIHIHFAAAVPNSYLGGLEYMTPESGLDPFHRLLASQLTLRGGEAVLSDRPGLGLDFDWRKVEEFARG
jgi:L-alanine-DL-glutamate epimerase-like enolase superfamily enzyme